MAGQCVLAHGLGRRAVVDHAAVPQHHRAVDQRLQRAQLVQDEQDRRAAADLFAQCGGEHLLAGQVDAGHRLVHDQQLRFAGQRAGDQHPLVLSAGERVDGVLGPVRHADQFQGAVHRGPVGLAQDAQFRTGEPAGRDDLADGRGDAAGRGGALRYVPDPGPVPEPAERRAEERQLAAGERDLADHGAYGGGLAGAVGAEQGHDLAGAHGQVDAAQHGAGPQGGGGPVQVDDRLGGRLVHGDLRHVLCGVRHLLPSAFWSAARLACCTSK